ncbi:MAG: CBS domain-containing protein [Oscillospiraceae bacterium]|nr:CBS domain-containing protein [Oscillospiraceae bacterium]
MKVSDCMGQNPVTIGMDASVSSAARLMARRNVGFLPVCQGGALMGVVTDRDLLLRCVAAGEDPNVTPVSRVMTGRVLTASPKEELYLASRRMAQAQVRRLPVVENGRLLGMVALSDVSRQEDYALETAQCLQEISNPVKKW